MKKPICHLKVGQKYLCIKKVSEKWQQAHTPETLDRYAMKFVKYLERHYKQYLDVDYRNMRETNDNVIYGWNNPEMVLFGTIHYIEMKKKMERKGDDIRRL